METIKNLELSFQKLIQQLQQENDILHQEVRQHNTALINQDRMIKRLQKELKSLKENN